MDRAESIELDEFESFRTQAYSGSKRKVAASKSLPGGREPRVAATLHHEGGASGGGAGGGVLTERRASRMEMVLKEEGYMSTMIEEPTEDADSGGSATEDAQLLARPTNTQLQPNHKESRRRGSSSSGGAERGPRPGPTGARSPVPTARTRLIQQTRLGRSYSCKPRPKPRSSLSGASGASCTGGGGAVPGGARPRSGSGALPYYKNLACRHSSLTTPSIFGDVGDVEIYRVRSFTTTAKGIVKHGDSFKIRSSPKKSPLLLQCVEQQGPPSLDQVTVVGDPTSPIGRLIDNPLHEIQTQEESEPQTVRVLITGSSGVGKSALTQQLMTSDYLGSREIAEDTGDNRVTVLLDEEESVVIVYDNQLPEDTDEISLDAHLVIFSVEDRTSFHFAEARLRELKAGSLHRTGPVVILVANKEDLVRRRSVTEDEGVHLAKKYGCKYTEVSAILNHKVDELLVGIIRQVRLRPQRSQSMCDPSAPAVDRKRYGCLPDTLLELFRRLVPRRDDVNKSCENLLAL